MFVILDIIVSALFCIWLSWLYQCTICYAHFGRCFYIGKLDWKSVIQRFGGYFYSILIFILNKLVLAESPLKLNTEKYYYLLFWLCYFCSNRIHAFGLIISHMILPDETGCVFSGWNFYLICRIQSAPFSMFVLQFQQYFPAHRFVTPCVPRVTCKPTTSILVNSTFCTEQTNANWTAQKGKKIECYYSTSAQCSSSIP